MSFVMRLVFCCGAIIACAALVSTAQEKVVRAGEKKSPTIAFSKDKKTVSVHCDKGEWTFQRPVVTSWDFKASGKTLWVATTGNDANDGSTDKPFRTIGKAVDVVAPGVPTISAR